MKLIVEHLMFLKDSPSASNPAALTTSALIISRLQRPRSSDTLGENLKAQQSSGDITNVHSASFKIGLIYRMDPPITARKSNFVKIPFEYATTLLRSCNNK
uniref:Uncharacterized protein n=1 Tax=Glossina palpalis gambiensis TaxID=67801 RepID=A0A1B0BIF3_9MUSC